MMHHINRYIVVLVLLIGIIVCGLTVRNVDNSMQQINTRLIGVEGVIKSMKATNQKFQTSTTKSIDELTKQVDEQERLIVELERIINLSN